MYTFTGNAFFWFDHLMMLLRRWHEFAADAKKRPHSAFPRELLRAVAAVSQALQRACGTSGGGGAAEAEHMDARAAADAVAAELLRV
jgi:hypothetical protein